MALDFNSICHQSNDPLIRNKSWEMGGVKQTDMDGFFSVISARELDKSADLAEL